MCSRQIPYASLSPIPPFRNDPQLRTGPKNAPTSESAQSVSSQVKNININESGRQTNKRTQAHFPDEAAQRSKRLTSGTLERGLSSLKQSYEDRPPVSGLKNGGGHEELAMQNSNTHPGHGAGVGNLLSSPQGQANMSSRDGQRSSFPSSSGQKNLSAQALGISERQSWSSRPSSPVNTYNEDGGILLQPETRPITQEQLVNEVKGVSLNLSGSTSRRHPLLTCIVLWLTFPGQEFMLVWSWLKRNVWRSTSSKPQRLTSSPTNSGKR